MFWLSLAKITVKLIPPRTTLLVVLISLFILKVAKIILTFILPKGILLLFFFPIHKVIHFSASSLPKAHLFYCIVLGRQRLLRWFLIRTLFVFWRLIIIILFIWILIIFVRFLFIIRRRNLITLILLFILIILRFFNLMLFAFFLFHFVLLQVFFCWSYFVSSL